MEYNSKMVGKIFTVFVIGISILVVALILNYLAAKLNISTWYDFVKNPKDTGLLSYLWLFVLYPFGLGLAAYITMKFFD